MARNQRKPSERSSKIAFLKVNVKGSGKVKKQSKDVTKVTKTKATIKCSKCSKVISGKNNKVKICPPCLKNIANLAKKNSAPPSKPNLLQNSKVKGPNKKINARASTSSNKNSTVATNILLDSKRVKSPSKARKSPNKLANKRKSNDGEIAKSNKTQTSANLKSNKQVTSQSDLSLGGKMGLRGKKRSYVQLASGVSDDENKAKKLKTSKATIPTVRGTRNKKPTPKASEWRSTISPKRKSPQKEKSKVETKRKSPKITPTSKTTSNSNKSVSPSKSNSGLRKSTPSSATTKTAKRLSNIKGDSKQSSSLGKNKFKTTPKTKNATPTAKTTTPTAKTTTPTTKTTTPTRSSNRRSAKFTSVTVQKKTKNSPVKRLSRVVKKDKSVKSSDANLKDGVICAKEILEDILISVAYDSDLSLCTDAKNSKKDINLHIDSTETLENNMAECVDDSNEKKFQSNEETCEEGFDAGATDSIVLHLSPEKDSELHLSPEKDIELHLSPEKNIELHLSPEKHIELHLSPETAETEMSIVESDVDMNIYQDKEKAHIAITEQLESVDSCKPTLSVGLEIDPSKVDNECHKIPKDPKTQGISNKICISDDDHITTQDSRSANDKPNYKLETKENLLSKNHHSSENIGEMTNVCPLDDKNEMPAVASPKLCSAKVSQNSTHANTDLSSSLPTVDSTKHIKPLDENFQLSVVSPSEPKNECNVLLQKQNLVLHSENKAMCYQALIEQSTDEIFNCSEKKAPALKCLPEEYESDGSVGKCCAENNLSSNGHAENGDCTATSIEDENKFSQSQTVASISPNLHSNTYIKTSKISSTDFLNEKSKALPIQDTFNEKGDIHCPTTKNEEQIHTEVKLDETSSSCSRQKVITAKNDNLHMEKTDYCKIEGEASVLITDYNNPNTGNSEESYSAVDINECKVINNEVLLTQSRSVNENGRIEESPVKDDNAKMEVDVIMSDNVAEEDGGGDSETRDNVELPITDGEDYTNTNWEVPAKYSNSDKLVSISFEESKNQTNDVLLTIDYEKSEDCKSESALLFTKDKNKSDETSSTKDTNHHKNNSDESLPTEEFESCVNETHQKLPEEDNVLKYDTDKQRLFKSESDDLMNEVSELQTVDKAPPIIDHNEKSYSLSVPVKHGVEKNDDELVTSVTGYSTDEQVDKTGEELSYHIGPETGECKTTQSDERGFFHRLETKLGEDKTKKEELPHQKEQLPSTEEHKASQSDQREISPSKNELDTFEGKTEKEQSCQEKPQKEEYKTAQSEQSATSDKRVETKPGEEKSEEEEQSNQKEESTQLEVCRTTHSNQGEILSSNIEIKTDEHKTKEGSSCQKEELPKLEKYTENDECETFSSNVEIKLDEDKAEEEPPLRQKAQSPQIEKYKTTQCDQRGTSTSQIEIKTDKESTSNLPLDNEVPVSRLESPMNVDNKTDLENNENCDELTLKVEETREDCISIDGTDVESMQCNSETRSSNRMSVDEEVITMDIDQDDTTVDGSECQNFRIKVSNELNMEVN